MSRRYECGYATKTELGTLAGEEACEEGILTGREVRAGGYVQVRDHAWVDGEWVRTGRT